jgi:hypothetical protein
MFLTFYCNIARAAAVLVKHRQTILVVLVQGHASVDGLTPCPAAYRPPTSPLQLASPFSFGPSPLSPARHLVSTSPSLPARSGPGRILPFPPLPAAGNRPPPPPPYRPAVGALLRRGLAATAAPPFPPPRCCRDQTTTRAQTLALLRREAGRHASSSPARPAPPPSPPFGRRNTETGNLR